MNILITGANGQLGNEMRLLSAEHPQHQYFFSDLFEPEQSPVRIWPIDITNAQALQQFVTKQAIDLIVNCAAYTNVDKAEEDEATAERINADAVRNIGACVNNKGMRVRVVHVSTDYVFSGDEHEPCREEDAVAPRTAYGRTKLHGEQLLLSVNPEAIIFRTAWLYSEFGNNFMKTMLRFSAERDTLKVVFDQIGTPTYALDLAAAIFAAIESPEWKAGIYHYTNEGVCSWFDFTHEIIRQHQMMDTSSHSCEVLPIMSCEYQYKTPRPHYSVLNKSKVKTTFGISIPHWTESLNRCMKNYLGL